MAKMWQVFLEYTHNGENSMIISERETIGVIGGADFDAGLFDMVCQNAGLLVAADGGADRAVALGRQPDYVIGDLDSISHPTRVGLPAERVIYVDDQDSTDFEKVLTRVTAPLLLGVGFLGDRLDHQMAVQTALVKFSDKKVLLIGADDIVFLCPPKISFAAPAHTRVSLYPMAAVTIGSTGLNWPTDGLRMAPDAQIGTSNHAIDTVTLTPDAPKCLVILPRSMFATVLPSLLHAPQWSVRAK